MSNFLEGLAAVLLPTLQTLETTAVSELLDKMHDADKEEHKLTLLSIYPALVRFRIFAEKTKTKFDNVGVEGLLNAVQISATKYGIELPDL